MCTTMGANSGADGGAAYEPGVWGSGVDTGIKVIRKMENKKVPKSKTHHHVRKVSQTTNGPIA